MMRREVEKQLRQEEERSSEVRRMPSARQTVVLWKAGARSLDVQTLELIARSIMHPQPLWHNDHCQLCPLHAFGRLVIDGCTHLAGCMGLGLGGFRRDDQLYAFGRLMVAG